MHLLGQVPGSTHGLLRVLSIEQTVGGHRSLLRRRLVPIRETWAGSLLRRLSNRRALP